MTRRVLSLIPPHITHQWGLILCFCFRVLLDRAHTDLDGICLDSDPEPEPLTSPLPRSPLRSTNASTSETNTSDPASSAHPPSSASPSSSPTPVDLSQILLNIKCCRWRHFRPRTLSRHLSGGGDLSRRGFRDFSRTLSGLTRTLSGGAGSQNRTGPAPAPVHGESCSPPPCCPVCCFFGCVHRSHRAWLCYFIAFLCIECLQHKKPI